MDGGVARDEVAVVSSLDLIKAFKPGLCALLEFEREKSAVNVWK